MSANPHANGGALLRPLTMPNYRDYAVNVPTPGSVAAESTRVLGKFLRDVMKWNQDGEKLPSVRSRRDSLQSARGGLRGHPQKLDGGNHRRRHRSRPGRPGHGGLKRAHVPGLAGGLSADRAAWLLLLLRGLHPHRRLDGQSARQMAQSQQGHPLAQANRVAQLPPHVPCLAAGPQRILAPGSRLHRSRRQQEGRDRADVFAAGRQLLAVGRRPLPAQPQLHQRHRRRKAAGMAMARYGRPRRGTARPAPESGHGRATRKASPTSSWPAPATCRRWRRWPR